MCIRDSEPQRVHPQFLKIVQPLDQAPKIADAILATIAKRFDVQLIDDGVLVPEGVGDTGPALRVMTRTTHELGLHCRRYRNRAVFKKVNKRVDPSFSSCLNRSTHGLRLWPDHLAANGYNHCPSFSFAVFHASSLHL